MRQLLFYILLVLSLSVKGQDRVQLYDDMCNPLQSVFCDYVRNESQTNHITSAGGEYIGTLIDDKLYGWGLFLSASGLQSYGQYRDGKLLFGLVMSDKVAKVGSDERYVMYDLSTGGIIRVCGAEGELPLEFPLVNSEDGEESPYCFKKETYGNGDVYIGEFYKGRRHGYGVYQWAGGDMWYGYYSEGYRNGYGMLVKPDYHVYYGRWLGDSKVE